MPRRMLACALLALLPACAAQQTAMVECGPQGCDAPPAPDTRAMTFSLLQNVASHELQCAASELSVRTVGRYGFSNVPEHWNDLGPWEVTGCGKRALYHAVAGYEDGYYVVIERGSFIEPAPPKS